MIKTNCLIIGSGPAGYTAAIYASRANLNPILYSGNLIGGQLITTTDVENYPGYPMGVNGSVMMDDLRKQCERFGTTIKYNNITKVDFDIWPFRCWSDESLNENKIDAQTIIIATGASPKWLGIDSENKYKNFGVSSCATCDGFFYRQKSVAVVGGGDTACEEALYLSNICTEVNMIIRDNSMKASQIMQKRVLEKSNIKLFWQCSVVEILGNNKVESINIRSSKDSSIKNIPVNALFVAIGHQPNSSIFKPYIKTDNYGYIITKPNSTQTNVPGIFACGDVQDNVFRQAIVAAGSGCMAAIEAERWLLTKEDKKDKIKGIINF